MDITAKKMLPNEFGVRIATLDERKFKEQLWNHKPLTDFWRIGKGYAKKLEDNKMYTMGDVARMSINNEDLLFKLFGVNAEFLIDHAWGYEPCTIEQAKSYKPTSNSISSGQVLHCPYDYKKTKLIVKEMVDNLVLDLVEKKLKASQFVLTIGYDIDNLTNPKISKLYNGEITTDMYGRKIPKHAHGTINIDHKTSSTTIIMNEVLKLYDRITNPILLVRRINLVASNVVSEDKIENKPQRQQLDLFTNYQEQDELNKKQIEREKEDAKIQKTILELKRRYGKNAILKGMNLEEGATAIERNREVGGHKG